MDAVKARQLLSDKSNSSIFFKGSGRVAQLVECPQKVPGGSTTCRECVSWYQPKVVGKNIVKDEILTMRFQGETRKRHKYI